MLTSRRSLLGLFGSLMLLPKSFLPSVKEKALEDGLKLAKMSDLKLRAAFLRDYKIVEGRRWSEDHIRRYMCFYQMYGQTRPFAVTKHCIVISNCFEFLAMQRLNITHVQVKVVPDIGIYFENFNHHNAENRTT